MFGGSGNIELCAPLAQLKREHGPLREQMEAYSRIASDLISIDDTAEAEAAGWRSTLEELHQKVSRFISELDPHSEREEGVLFPMMARYIGRDTGPIAVMEYEHDQAKSNLKLFRTGMEGAAPESIDLEKAQELAGYAHKAYTILTDHFMKEENVLFPMAQQMLSDEEKEQLARQIQA
jgi:regulator of cell morphogenesis and NO signaling